MCGIVGYIGRSEAYPVLMAGLRSLEYRGYDSAGVALLNPKGILRVYKTRGRVANLEAAAEGHDLSGCVGIAHTRWATHGEPNDINAHPHLSMSGDIALVHNGIIENYLPLRAELEARGFRFVSQTDTEVLVQLIEYCRTSENADLFTAVRHALHRVEGSYAIEVIDRRYPNIMVVARKSSPLVVGLGDGDLYVASDATPIARYTNRVIYFDDETVARLEQGREPIITDLDGHAVPHTVRELDISASALDKGDYPHYMLKEIFEQRNTLAHALEGRIHDYCIRTDSIDLVRFARARRVVFISCGTSWHAALVARYAFERLAHVPADVEYAGEFRYRNPVLTADDLVIAISQSGETADTLAAIELARSHGAYTVGVCNVEGSSIARLTDNCCFTCVGPEIGVASTKAFTGQLVVLTLLALVTARAKQVLPDTEYRAIIDDLVRLPELVEPILHSDAMIELIARQYTNVHDFLFLGRDICYPIALEGALKLKEISYIHAEGYPAAEMKHGPIALISPEMPTMVVATECEIYNKVVSNIQEVKARRGPVIAVVTEGDTEVRRMADHVIEVPRIHPILAPILAIVPLQLFAYHIAVARGCNVDQPRNLAKSVTVE